MSSKAYRRLVQLPAMWSEGQDLNSSVQWEMRVRAFWLVSHAKTQLRGMGTSHNSSLAHCDSVRKASHIEITLIMAGQPQSRRSSQTRKNLARLSVVRAPTVGRDIVTTKKEKQSPSRQFKHQPSQLLLSQPLGSHLLQFKSNTYTG